MGKTTAFSQSTQKIRNHSGVLAALFDQCGEVCQFMKDRRHRFVRCNQALLAIHGLENEQAMLGKTDHDFHPPLLADSYVAEDERIVRSGDPVCDAVWLVTTQVSSRWYSCTKLPIFDEKNPSQILGVAGVMVPYEGRGELPRSFERIKDALHLADQQYASGVQVPDLASAVGLSKNQFTRLFGQLFHMAPGEYLLRLKLGHASRELRQTNKRITVIALEAGFYDHSAFTKAFQKHNGISPKDYRRRFKQRSVLQTSGPPEPN